MTKLIREQLYFILAIFSASAFALHYGMRQFGGYDLSHLIDLQGRFSRGDTPGTDFINTLPFSYLLIVKLSGLFASPTWATLIWMNLIAAFMCSIIILSHWPKGLPIYKKYSSIFLIYLPVIGVGHIWHSALSQIIGVTYIILALNFFDQSNEKNIYTSILLALIAGMFFFSKQNIGLPLIFGICASLSITCMLWPKYAKHVGSFILINLIGILISCLLFLLILHAPISIVVQSFTNVLDRSTMSETQINDLVACLVQPTSIGMVGFFILLLYTFKNQSDDLLRMVTLITCLLISVIPIITDWDLKLCSFSLFIFACICLSNYQTRPLKVVALVLGISLLWSALQIGVNRQRMFGSGDFIWNPADLVRIDNGYFNGLYAGFRLHGVRYEIQKALQAESDKPVVFFGPRIEFSYTDNNLKSPHMLPLWWHPGSSYPLSIEKSLVDNFAANHFTLLIFLSQDRTRIPRQIIEYINNNYDIVDGFKMIDVYRRKR